MITDKKQKFQIQTEMTEMEMNFRKANEIPDFLPQIWPSRKKSKEEVNDETSKKDLMINKKELKCLIAPIKTSKTIFHASNELPDCDVIDVKMLPTFSASTRSLSPDFILRNPKNAVLLLQKKNVIEKDEIVVGEERQKIKDTITNHRNEKPSTSSYHQGDNRMDFDNREKHASTRRISTGRIDYDRLRKHDSTHSKYDDNEKNGSARSNYDDREKHASARSKYDDRVKHESSKRKHETQSKKYSDEIKNPKAETSKRDSSSSSVSISSKPSSTSLNQHVSSLSSDYKIPKNGSNISSFSSSAAEVKPFQTLSSSQANLASKNSISSNLPKPKQYLSPQPAAVVAPAAATKTQTKLFKSSSRGFSESPRPITGGKHISFKKTWTPPITGGKTIRMTQHQPSRHEPYKRCKPQPQKTKTLPRCELVADSGIKMIIRLPKKV